jgi:asparagine synthase (glutamine-hydrolysing)
MFFCGQNFPDQNFLSILRSRCGWQDFTNAAYLLDAYDHNPQNFFTSLNGWFCGVLADANHNVVQLFNDRYGMGRIYVYEASDGFYFASEAKALLSVRKELRQIDLQGLGDFFSCGCVLGNRTLFRGISLLPAASLWTFRSGILSRRSKYFKIDAWEDQTPLSRDAFIDELDSTFDRLLPRYCKFSRSSGFSLTGGLDTRMILAYMDFQPADLPCYTFAGKAGDTLDVQIARSVAKACGLTHNTLRLGHDFFHDFSDYASKTVYLSDGCHSVCRSHDIYFNALARTVAPVRLTGTFGSEILRGARQLWASPPEDVFEPTFRSYVAAAASRLKATDDSNEIAFAAFVEIPWHAYGCLAIEQSQLNIVTPYLDNDLVKLAFRGAKLLKAGQDVRVTNILRRRPELLNIPSDRGWQRPGFSSWVSRQIYGSLLFKGDWFFHYMPHRFAKLGAILEHLQVQNLFLGRHFMTDYRAWFQQDLRDFVQDTLLGPHAKAREYMNGRIIEQMVQSHVTGERCYLSEIDKALTVELIHSRLLEMS